MPLPANFPPAPKRPPASQPIVGPDGKPTQALTNYFDAVDRLVAALRKLAEG